ARRASARHDRCPAARLGGRRDTRALPHAETVAALQSRPRAGPRLRHRGRSGRGGGARRDRRHRRDCERARAAARGRLVTDFWVSSGYQLLDRDTAGRLTVTPEFLKAYLARPEVVPPEEACAAERQLHARLISDPIAQIRNEEIAAL